MHENACTSTRAREHERIGQGTGHRARVTGHRAQGTGHGAHAYARKGHVCARANAHVGGFAMRCFFGAVRCCAVLCGAVRYAVLHTSQEMAFFGHCCFLGVEYAHPLHSCKSFGALHTTCRFRTPVPHVTSHAPHSPAT